jgi:hypothetical protein
MRPPDRRGLAHLESRDTAGEEKMNATLEKVTPALPCPFCGGNPKVSVDAPNDEIWIACESDSCEVTPAVSARTPQDVFARWNKRA